jgi:hypothetical protein
MAVPIGLQRHRNEKQTNAPTRFLLTDPVALLFFSMVRSSTRYDRLLAFLPTRYTVERAAPCLPGQRFNGCNEGALYNASKSGNASEFFLADVFTE